MMIRKGLLILLVLVSLAACSENVMQPITDATADIIRDTGRALGKSIP